MNTYWFYSEFWHLHPIDTDPIILVRFQYIYFAQISIPPPYKRDDFWVVHKSGNNKKLSHLIEPKKHNSSFFLDNSYFSIHSHICHYDQNNISWHQSSQCNFIIHYCLCALKLPYDLIQKCPPAFGENDH